MKRLSSFSPFLDTLNNWYIRRSRSRVWSSEAARAREDGLLRDAVSCALPRHNHSFSILSVRCGKRLGAPGLRNQRSSSGLACGRVPLHRRTSFPAGCCGANGCNHGTRDSGSRENSSAPAAVARANRLVNVCGHFEADKRSDAGTQCEGDRDREGRFRDRRSGGKGSSEEARSKVRRRRTGHHQET